MAVYSNTDILQAIKDNTIICLPFNKQHVSEASLDFTLGYYYYRQEDRYVTKTVQSACDRLQALRPLFAHIRYAFRAERRGDFAVRRGDLLHIV